MIPDQLINCFRHLSPVFLCRYQLPVQNLDTWMDIQDTAAQTDHIADSASGPEKFQIVRQKAHLRPVDQLLRFFCRFIYRHLRMLLQDFRYLHNDGHLPDRYLPGIDRSDIASILLLVYEILLGSEQLQNV